MGRAPGTILYTYDEPTKEWQPFTATSIPAFPDGLTSILATQLPIARSDGFLYFPFQHHGVTTTSTASGYIEKYILRLAPTGEVTIAAQLTDGVPGVGRAGSAGDVVYHHNVAVPAPPRRSGRPLLCAFEGETSADVLYALVGTDEYGLSEARQAFNLGRLSEPQTGHPAGVWNGSFRALRPELGFTSGSCPGAWTEAPEHHYFPSWQGSLITTFADQLAGVLETAHDPDLDTPCGNVSPSRAIVRAGSSGAWSVASKHLKTSFEGAGAGDTTWSSYSPDLWWWSFKGGQ